MQRTAAYEERDASSNTPRRIDREQTKSMSKPIICRRKVSPGVVVGLLVIAMAQNLLPSFAFRGDFRRFLSVPRIDRQPRSPISLIWTNSIRLRGADRVWSPCGASRVAASDRNHEKSASLETVPCTMSNAIVRFFLGKNRGPLIIVALLAYLTEWRLTMGPVGLTDALACSSMFIAWMFQEHLVHDKLLHSDFDWIGKQIHREHHNKPYHHISIDPAPLMIAWLGAAHLMLRCILPIPLAISATLGYAVSGLLYEWSHYIVHCKVKPPSPFWKRVRDNHIRHHLVDDRYWLSFTVPAVDDWFGTNPSLDEVRREKSSFKRNLESVA